MKSDFKRADVFTVSDDFHSASFSSPSHVRTHRSTHTGSSPLFKNDPATSDRVSPVSVRLPIADCQIVKVTSPDARISELVF